MRPGVYFFHLRLCTHPASLGRIFLTSPKLCCTTLAPVASAHPILLLYVLKFVLLSLSRGST